MKTNNFKTRHIKLCGIAFIFTLLITALTSSVKSQSVSSNFVINADTQCLVGNHFVFDNTIVGDGYTYYWDFGNNTNDTIANPIISYANSGNYTVTLTTTKNSISNTFSRNIFVAPNPVVSNITLQGTASGFSYTYISSSTIISGNMEYMWDFGDSVGSSLINPVHTYNKVGTYPVYLTVTSDFGCTAGNSYSAVATLADSTIVLPLFTVSSSKQCTTNNLFSFKMQANLDGVAKYWWDFGDGLSSNDLNPTKTYTTPGKYIVKLYLLKNGNTYTNEKIVTVGATINTNYDFIVKNDNGDYFFINQTTQSHPSIHYQWSFGDGLYATEKNATHQFFNGNYVVKLIARDSSGCVDSISKNLVITSNLLTNAAVDFTINKDTQCLKSNLFLFTNTIIQNPNISYTWNFGDGTTVTGKNPQKTYQNTGSYNVQLTIKAGTYQYSVAKTVFVKNEAIWAGTVSSVWSDTANWLCGIPTDTTDVIITKGSLYNLILNSQTLTIRNLIVENGATFTAINSNITIKGNVLNAGNINASTSLLNFNGSNKQSITGSLNVGKLISNNPVGIEILSAASDTVNVYDVFTLKQGVFTTNNLLNFKSNIRNTGMLDKVGVDGNTGSIIGQVNIERYFQNKRGWRFITSPISANGNNANYSLNNTWQKFTNITGPSGVGFDFYSNFYQANYWSDSLNKWINVTNTFTNYIANNKTQFANIPYFFFVRGDRSITGAYLSSEATTSVLGYLQTGNQTMTFNNKKKGNYVFIGNPYAAPVDLALITSSGTTGNFYLYDPTLNETGAYVTVSNKGNGNWVITPASAQKDKLLQSGQAVLVEVAGASGSITFTESAKATKNNMAVFGGTTTNNIDRLEVNLYRVNSDNSKTLLDGAVTIFSDKYSKDVDADDSKKILNSRDNIGFQNGSDILSIEARPFVSGEDSISIYTSGLIDSIQYAIEIIPIYKDSSLQQIVLADSMLKANSNIALSGKSWYYFNTISNNNVARFSLHLKSNVVATSIKNLKAIQENKAISLSWQVDGAENIKEYLIEHSLNGIDFVKIANVKLLSYNDNLSRKLGLNFYKISAINKNDVVQATAIVKANFSEQPTTIKESYFSVYPNPTNGKITAEFISESAQDLQITIVSSSTGKAVKTIFIKAKVGINKLAINLIDAEESINNGLYVLKMVGSESGYPAQKILLIKK